MQDTQKYLNEILKKRLGSVVNYGSSMKTANTVTRIPKQQQKIEHMPTVFRKKHQTVYVQDPNAKQFYSQAQSSYLSIKQNAKGFGNKINEQSEMPQQNRQSSNQRVEYMLISKRIQSKKQDDFVSPTVDVTKYAQLKKRQEQMMNNINHCQHKSNIYTGSQKQIHHSQSESFLSQKAISKRNSEQYESQSNDYAMGSKLSRDTDKSKRKKIFGAQ